MITFLCEWIMSIPIISFVVLLVTDYKILFVLILLHVLSIITSKKSRLNHVGNTIGVIACIAGFFPKIGIVLHFVSALVLLFNQFSMPKRRNVY